MQLTAENVTKIFTDCLFNNGESTDNAKNVSGVMQNFGFNPDKIEKHEHDIYSMLMQLPERFQDGWSFLNACMDKNGNQWTGMHNIMEQLFVLGMACDKVVCVLPKRLWKELPGNMPYYMVL